MKVRKLWVCECEATTVYTDAEDENKLIVRGDAYHHTSNHTGPQFICCRGCARRFYTTPQVAQMRKLRKVWECHHIKVFQDVTREDEDWPPEMVAYGEFAIRYGSPMTHIRCAACGQQYRIAPDVQFYGHLKAKQEKREGSKKNRRAKKRRARS